MVVVAALRRWHSSAAVEVEEEELSPLYRGLRHRSGGGGAAESDSLAVALGRATSDEDMDSRMAHASCSSSVMAGGAERWPVA